MKPTWLRRLGYFLLPLAFRLLLKFDVQGREHIPPSGPLIVAPNHANFVDPFVLEWQLHLASRLMVLFAKAEIMTTPGLGWLARRYMVIPVRRGEGDADALKAALRVLKADGALYVAPEGTRSPTGELLRGKPGAVVMAQRTGATIVPAAMWGHKSFWSNLKRLRRTPLSLRFGPPFRFVTAARPDKDELQAMADEIMYRIAALMPPEWRGAYAGDPPPFRYTYTVEGATDSALAAATEVSM